MKLKLRLKNWFLSCTMFGTVGVAITTAKWIHWSGSIGDGMNNSTIRFPLWKFDPHPHPPSSALISSIACPVSLSVCPLPAGLPSELVAKSASHSNHHSLSPACLYNLGSTRSQNCKRIRKRRLTSACRSISVDSSETTLAIDRREWICSGFPKPRFPGQKQCCPAERFVTRAATSSVCRSWLGISCQVHSVDAEEVFCALLVIVINCVSIGKRHPRQLFCLCVFPHFLFLFLLPRNSWSDPIRPTC